jgi:signal transduction histidine kinase
MYCCKDAQRDGVQRFFRIGVAVSLAALSCLEATGFKAGRGAALGFSPENAYWWGWAALLLLAAQTTTLLVALFREAGREHSLYETEREERNLAEANAAAEHRRSDALRRANAEILSQQELVERQARQIEGMNNALFENNRQLAEQNLALKELHREKDEMLGVVAHDLKNPLSNIASFASVLQHDDGSLAPSQRGEFLGLITDSADRMFRIIRNLLDINALERGGVRAHLQAVELSSLLEYGISSYTKRALEKNIAIAMNFQPAPLALGDEHLVMQIFDNLLSNALKYSPFNTAVCVELFAVGDKVRFSVRDEGPGLTEDDKQKLFGKFARLSAEPTGGEHSTGLGLSIVKKMVEMMGGEVWCESESGKGAAFVVELREYKPEEHSESESA